MQKLTWLAVALAVAGLGEIQAEAQGPMIVAHRGASYDAPENTLAAFHEGWRQGADAIEGDFYLTGDGKIIALHDKTTARTTGKKHDLKVAEATVEQLRHLDVGTWKDARFAGERMPLLEEVLATIPEHGKIFLEIKSGPEIVEPLRKELDQTSLRPEQIVIICFNQEVVKKCRELMPQFKANWLTSYKRDPQTGQWSPSLESVLKALEYTGATGLGTQANDAVVTREFVVQVRKAGVECHVWTVNDPAQARRYANLAFDSITTDRPAFIREAIESQTASE